MQYYDHRAPSDTSSTSANTESIRLRADLDTSALTRQFSRARRVRIHDVLEAPSADAVYEALLRNRQWNAVCRTSDGHVETDWDALRKWPRGKRERLSRAIHKLATYGFQYRYRSFPIRQQSLAGHSDSETFERFLEFVNRPGFLNFVRRVVGTDGIAFADAQATVFRRGDFLNMHTDEVANLGRQFAYVFGFTPAWRPEWGGALTFPGDNGNCLESHLPGFNVLTLFEVPTTHFVSAVAPFAGAERYSITGWLRR